MVAGIKGRLGIFRWVAVFVTLLSVCFAASVFAAAPEGDGDKPAENVTAPAPTAAELEPAQAAAEPMSAVEVLQTQSAFADLAANESRDLLVEEFPEQLSGLNGDPARTLTGLEIEKPLGTNGVLVAIGGGESAIVETSIPVESEVGTGDKAPVDLTLEREGDHYASANPPSATELPATAEAPIALENGVEIGLPAGNDHEAQPLGEMNLFFPETEPTTDTMVAAIGGGVEVFEQLRSPESPEEFRFPLSLPGQARVITLEEGGAEIVSADGKPLVSIPAPTATDANGKEVPVTMTVESDELVVKIPHESAELAYPILLDPIWDAWNQPGYGVFSEPWWFPNNWSGRYNLWDEGSSLHAATVAGWGYGAEWAQFEYTPPNATAYIEAGTFSNISYFVGGKAACQTNTPYGYLGIWNVSVGYQPYPAEYKGGNSFSPSWSTGLVGGVGTRKAVVGVGGGTAGIPCAHEIFVGGVTLQENDAENPSFASISGVPSGWFKTSQITPITVYGYDPGFGVKFMRLYDGGPLGEHYEGCNGTITARCPEWTPPWTVAGPPYVPGVHTLEATIEDATGKVGAWYATTKYDPYAPKVDLEGQLAAATQQEGTTQLPQTVNPSDHDELSASVYNLKVSATDDSGIGASEQSGVKRIEVLLDGVKVNKEAIENTTPCDGCGLARTIPIGLTELSPMANHVVRVLVTDEVGNQSERKIEFEYIPATGMEEKYVLQQFPLDDGQNHEGEEVNHGPELAVNVMNGNLVFHERDVDAQGPSVDLEVERFYNSLQPSAYNGEWGDGWSVAQTPSVAASGSGSGSASGTGGSIRHLSGSGESEYFDPNLHAVVDQGSKGVRSLTGEDGNTTHFNNSGQVTEVDGPGPGTLQYSYAGGHLDQIAVEDPTSSTTAPAEPPEVPPAGITPEYKGSFASSESSGAGSLADPTGIAVAPGGGTFVVDQGNDRVERFSPSGSYSYSFGSSGSGEGELDRPTAVAVGRNGYAYVADSGNGRIEVFEDGEYISSFGGPGTGPGQFAGAGPEGIAVAPNGDVWVSDTYGGRLEKFSPTGEFLGTAGSSGSGSGQLGEPLGLAVAADGTVFVADWENDRVSAFDQEGEFVRQFGTSGSGHVQFDAPVDVEVDGMGNVWVADQGNHRIEELDQSGTYIDEFGASGGLEAGQLASPAAVTVNSSGRLWVVDAGAGEEREPVTDPVGLVAAWSFDEGEGGTVEDLTGNGNDGTIEGATWTAGKSGSALEFDGEESCVMVPDSPALRLEEEFTLEAWVRPASERGFAPIFFKEDSENNYGYTLMAGGSEWGVPTAFINDATWPVPEVEAEEELENDVWSHVALTEDGSHMRLYVDGKLVASGPSGGSIESDGALRIGCGDNFGFEDYFEGRIDEPRVFDRALSGAEVAADAKHVVGAPKEGPVLAYSFDKDDEESVEDLSGMGNDGELEVVEWDSIGHTGGALDFDGTTSCVKVPNSASLQLGHEFTLEAWVRASGRQLIEDPIFFKENDPELEFWEVPSYWMSIGFNQTGKPQGYTEGAMVTGPNSISKNVWTHVAFTYDGSALRIYVNGELEASNPIPGLTMSSPGALYIGCAGPYEEYFDGMIDDARIYERALTWGEVRDDSETPVEAVTVHHPLSAWKLAGYIPSYSPAPGMTFGSSGSGENQLNSPSDVAYEGSAGAFVSDSGNNRIAKYSGSGEFLGTFGSVGSGNGKLSEPQALAGTQDEGYVWVADTGNDRIEEFRTNGEFKRTAGGSSLSEPGGIAVAPDGDVWVADTGHDRLEVFNATGEFIETVSSSGSGPEEMDRPLGVAIGSDGDVWVADSGNDRIDRYAEDGAYVGSFGESGSAVGQLSEPSGISVDAHGLIWVTDTGNDRVQAFDEEGNGIYHFGSAGTRGGQFDFASPAGIDVVSEGGWMWVVDPANDRIQTFVTPAWEAEEEAMAIIEEPNDPVASLEWSSGLVTAVEVERAGEGAETIESNYEYSGGELVAHDGPEGEAQYEYDAAHRMTKVVLPNEAGATITYDAYGRVTSVTVYGPGWTAGETTEFEYSLEPRRTTVIPAHSRTMTWDIGLDGSVLKWHNAAEPPVLTLTGNLFFNKETENPIETGTYNLEALATSPEGVESIEIVAGSSIVADVTCKQTPEPGIECKEEDEEWVIETAALPPGILQVEVRATDRNGLTASSRFWVNIPYTPPPDPEQAKVPTFTEVKEYRRTHGLDLDLNLPAEKRELNSRIFAIIGAWANPNKPEGQVARYADEQWGVPMRPVDVTEMEYREWYLQANLPLVEEWGEEHASVYAGYDVDDEAGGIIRVGFTTNPSGNLAALEAQEPLVAAPERFAAYLAPQGQSLQSLRELEHAIGVQAESNAVLSAGITQFMVNPRSDVVMVAARNPVEVEAVLHSTYGSSAPIEVFQDSGGGHGSSGRMMAGEKVLFGTDSYCTAGYGAWERVPTKTGGYQFQQYLLTAGHCGHVGEHVSKYLSPRGANNSFPIGEVDRTGFPGGKYWETDALAVRLSGIDAPRYIYRAGWPARRVTHVGRPRSGDELCFSGYKTGAVTCGKYLWMGTWNYRGEDESTGPHGFARTIQMEAQNLAGDSGAPVWDKTTGYVVGLLGGRIDTQSFPDAWNGRHLTWVTPLIQPKGFTAAEAPGVLGLPGFQNLKLEEAP